MALVDMKSNLAISKPQPGLEPKIGVIIFLIQTQQDLHLKEILLVLKQIIY